MTNGTSPILGQQGSVLKVPRPKTDAANMKTADEMRQLSLIRMRAEGKVDGSKKRGVDLEE